MKMKRVLFPMAILWMLFSASFNIFSQDWPHWRGLSRVGKAFIPVAIMKIADTPVYAHPILAGNRIYIKDAESVFMYVLD